MHLYRKVVPKIARDVIRTLRTQNLIEVEDSNVDEAELDVAAIMVEYLNSEDRITKEAKEAMARRGLSADKFPQVKKTLAEAKGIKLGDDAIDYVLAQVVEALFASKNIAEIFAEDHQLKKIIREIIEKYLSISEELDREARGRLKNVRENTPEWDIEYPRMIAQLKRQKGLV